MKKIMSLLLFALFLVSSLSVSTFAAERPNDLSLTELIAENELDVQTEECVEEYTVEYADEYVVSSVAPAMQIACAIDSNALYALSVDNVIENSTGVVTCGTSLSGSYKSAKYDAGLSGFKYRISFDWEATVNAAGDYIFSTITNAAITTYRGLLTGFLYTMCYYDITNNVYYISSDRKSVTFETAYEFHVYDDYGYDYEVPAEHIRTIYLDDLL